MSDTQTFLANLPLFADIMIDDIPAILSCLQAKKIDFCKNQTIMYHGQTISYLGLILSGNIQIIRENFSGHRSLLNELGPGELFAESFACSSSHALPVSVIAITDGSFLRIDYHRLLTTCSSACTFHSTLIRNMLSIIADKNIALTRRMEHLSQRTTGAKLLSYLQEQAELNNDTTFTIPFNRQELSDFLCVDRSAMSTTLSNLQAQGRLRYKRNTFHLLQTLEP